MDDKQTTAPPLSAEGQKVRDANMRRRNISAELRERGDEVSLIAADEIDRLREKTANEIAWTHEPTKERVVLFSPWARSFEIAGEFPGALKVFAAVQKGDFEEVNFDE